MRKGKPLPSAKKSSPAMQAYSRAVKKGMKNYHVVKNGKGWIVKRAGSSRVSDICKTQEKAKSSGLKLAKKYGTELFIHGRDGRIRKRI